MYVQIKLIAMNLLDDLKFNENRLLKKFEKYQIQNFDFMKEFINTIPIENFNSNFYDIIKILKDKDSIMEIFSVKDSDDLDFIF